MNLIKLFIKLLIFVLAISAPGYSITKNPDLILKKVVDAFNKIKDYEVNISIKVDVDFVKVPNTKAKIFFKQPDKMHFESETFAMLPREGFDYTPTNILKSKHTAFYERQDTIDKFETAVIKIIPLGEANDVILSTVWVDESKYFIRKIETTTKTKGTLLIELKYEHRNLDFPLPSMMIFSFNVDRMNIPRGFNGDLSNREKQKKKDDKPTTTGKVYVTYSNYKVNGGIPDSIFEKKKKTKN
ncbi:MAG: hypothetical protein HXY50_06810 [Ignavibacteriaceae bacterium]|nr:hypothetical protein [Ignavibacteriaceae bacterium]